MATNEVVHDEVLTGIEAAVRRVGSQAKLAEHLNIKQQAVSLWVQQGYAPERHVDAICEVSGVPVVRLMRPETVERILRGAE